MKKMILFLLCLSSVSFADPRERQATPSCAVLDSMSASKKASALSEFQEIIASFSKSYPTLTAAHSYLMSNDCRVAGDSECDTVKYMMLEANVQNQYRILIDFMKKNNYSTQALDLENDQRSFSAALACSYISTAKGGIAVMANLLSQKEIELEGTIKSLSVDSSK